MFLTSKCLFHYYFQCNFEYSRWSYGKWPLDWAHCNTVILEFNPIDISLYLLGHEISHQGVLFFTDKEALVHFINKQSCKDKPLMSFVRKLDSICLQNDIVFKAKHNPILLV